jgi:hypothetical protein
MKSRDLFSNFIATLGLALVYIAAANLAVGPAFADPKTNPIKGFLSARKLSQRNIGVPNEVLAYQTTSSQAAGSSPFTFSSIAIGTAAANRYVIVGIGATATPTAVLSVTVGGIAATQVVSQVAGNSIAAIWIALVPTGTTATIVITFTGSTQKCSIGVWSATGISPTALSTASSTANPASLALTTINGGFAIAHMEVDSTGTYTWTNATQRYAANIDSFSSYSGADALTSTSSLTITATPTGGSTARPSVAASW